MRVRPADVTRRAERLLRWYPKSWRARYGDEFAALLISDLSERPRSWPRTADVVRSAMVARLTGAGLTRHRLEPTEQVRASLACLGCTVAVFVAFGAALWAQLTVGWQWAAPAAVGTAAAMVVMSSVMFVFAALGLLAAVPVAASVLVHIGRRQTRGLVRPTALFLGAAALLIVGSRHFGNGWPGTGGHHWVHQGLVPGGVAAFLWASSLSISSYWAHPGALLGFPAPEVAWMVVSPLALVGMVVGATKILRRVELLSAGPALRRTTGENRRGRHGPVRHRLVSLARRRRTGAEKPVPCRRHRLRRAGHDDGGRGDGAAGGGRRPSGRRAHHGTLTAEPTSQLYLWCRRRWRWENGRQGRNTDGARDRLCR